MILFCFSFWLSETRSLLHSPGDPPASASLRLELQLCVTIPSLLNIFFCYCWCCSTQGFSENADRPGTHFVDRSSASASKELGPRCAPPPHGPLVHFISLYLPIPVLPTLDISYESCFKGNSLIYFKSKISLFLF